MKIKSFSVFSLYIWLFLFSLIPLLLILLVSFLSQNQQDLIALPFTIKNYQTLFNPIFSKILLRSTIIAAITTLICLGFAYPFSYLLIKAKHQSILLLLIIIPFWTSSLVRTYSLIAILKFKGLLNLILLKFHLVSAPISLLYTHFAVIVGLVYNLFPFMVLPLFTSMEQFDFRLIDAAKDLGASRWAVFYRVFLPNTTKGIISGCILVFLPAMTLFYIPNVLGGSRSALIGNFIQEQFLVSENWPRGSASSIILTFFLIFLLLIYRQLGRKFR